MQQKDIEALIANARTERMKTSRQLTLGDLIQQLEGLPLTFDYNGKPHPKRVYFDFACTYPRRLDSWRGAYSELAITFAVGGGPAPSAPDFLAMLKGAIGATFPGYKGGEYTMGEDTPVWIANYGYSGNTGVVGVRDWDYQIVIDTAWCEF